VEVITVAETSRLPTPVAEAWEWQRHGSCRNLDSAMFFHPDGERGFARADRVARAKQICQSCPVIVQCRKHALTVQEPFGVWGGLDETERRQAIARRNQVPPAA
jgi:WhiB family redox-sensing transcriptional regulator